MKKTRRASIVLLAVACIGMIFSGCAKSVKDKAIAEVKAVKETAYMTEEQKDIKTLKEDYTRALEKAKSDKDIKKIAKQFKADLKTFATKKDKINAYKNLVLEQAGEKKAEAEKVLKEYDKKLKAVKSNADLETLASEINAKLTEATGQTVEVTTSQVETSTPAAKQIAKQQNKQGGASAGSSLSRAKQRVWVVDKAAWTETKYRTESYQYNVYRTSDGKEFDTYAQAYAYYEKMGDEGIPINFGAVTKTGTRQVPYTVTHPEVGHWECR